MKTIASLTCYLLFLGTSFSQWDNFTPPTINFTDVDNNQTEGAQIYHRLVPDKVAYISPVCEDVARLLFFNDTEPVTVSTLNYIIEDYNGVSAKSGSPPTIQIKFSTRHVLNTWNATQNDTKVEAEIYGILFHEMTHGYQVEPKGAGSYDGSSAFWAQIEGIADAVRIRAGYHQDRLPNVHEKKWLTGYTTTGFFYNWIANNYDQDFIAKLNLSGRTIDPWSFEAACLDILGIEANALWDEYVSKINDGDKPAPSFVADQTEIEVGESVTFSNTTENALYYDWTFEGGTPRRSQDTSPTIQYTEPGVYKVTLVAHNKSAKGPGIKVEQKYITVGELEDCNLLSTSNWGITHVSSEETIQENGRAIQVFDGDPSTIWHTEYTNEVKSYPHEIQLDLGENLDLCKLKCLPRQTGTSNGIIKEYEFYVSEDGVEWNTPVVTGEFTNTREEKTVYFPKTSGRYAKFVALSEINGNPWASLAELKLYGAPSPTSKKHVDKGHPKIYPTFISGSSDRISIRAMDGIEKVDLQSIDGRKILGHIVEIGQKEYLFYIDQPNLKSGIYYLFIQDGDRKIYVKEIVVLD